MGEKRRKSLEAAIAEAELKDAQAYEDWKNLKALSERILQGDIDAYFQVMEKHMQMRMQDGMCRLAGTLLRIFITYWKSMKRIVINTRISMISFRRE